METIVHVQPLDENDLDPQNHAQASVTETSALEHLDEEDRNDMFQKDEMKESDMAVATDNPETICVKEPTDDVDEDSEVHEDQHEQQIHTMRQKMCDMIKNIQQQQIAELFPFLGSRETTEGSEDSVICRICHTLGEEKLISPCRCKGSTQFVHESCLLTWFKKSVKSHCELCHGNIPIKKKYKPLSEWRKWEDRPVPVIWFIIFFIGLCLNILSIYVNASDQCTSTACVIFYVVNGFGILLDSAFLYFWWIKCSIFWKKWLALNQDWFIKEATSHLHVVYNESGKTTQEIVQIILEA